jgi:multiple sugar transport system ATP-binding protein
MASVTLDRVSKRWGGFVGVDAVSLAVADEEFVVLLGPSGCGKTTTMRMIAGLEEPTAGEIRIDERVVNDVPPRDRDLAMVFQNYGLYPHMTVAENIAYPLKVRRVPRAEREERVRRAAERVELLPFLHRRPAELSGGQRQRVALARAIVRTPRLFLMDEPLSNLDAQLRSTMRGQLKHLQRELAITTVYVTHDQVEAMTLADRIVVMRAGVLQQVGAPADIYDRPANTFVATFVGSPPMNLLRGEAADGRFRHPTAAARIAVAAAGPVILGQRPEELSLAAPGEGDLAGTVYSAELLGDSTLVTVEVGPDRVVVKADKACPARMGDRVGVALDRARLHLFEPEGGTRLGPPGPH